MGQIDMTAPDTVLYSYWQYNSSGKRIVWSEDSKTLQFNVVDLPKGAIVRRATLSATLGGPWKSGVTKAMFYGKDVRGNLGSSISIRINLRSNRMVSVAISFKATPSSYAESGTSSHHNQWSIRNVKLSIVYDTGEYSEAPDEPRMVLVPERTVKLFSPRETVFTGNGLCILTPTECVVSEEAGGEYELSLEHPIDNEGRWELIREDYIIEAPIPPTYIKKIKMPPWEIWLTNKETSLYSTLPTYTKAKNGVDAVKADPTHFAWQSSVRYEPGDPSKPYVTFSGMIFAPVKMSIGVRPTVDEGPEHDQIYWTFIAMISDGNTPQTKPQYNPGKIAETIAEGELVYKVSDYNSTWMQVRSLRGITGYVRIADCTKQEGSVEQVEPARVLYTQLFRIYEISGEDDTHMIRASARHISYDFQKNVMFDCQLEECEPATAIASIQGSLVNPDETLMLNRNRRLIGGEWVPMPEPTRRQIITDLTSPTLTVNWSYQNPVQALLDPEEGLVGKTKAKVIRDNQDIYILDNSTPRRGPDITYGVNMRGVTWTRSTDEVVTRVIPRAKDKDDKYIYLADLYIDSDAIGEYAVISTEILDSQYKVGQKIKHLDGSESELSLSDVQERMLSEAEDRFYVDHCDAVSVALEVEFLLLGDTEEFRQYRNLQRLQLYDQITVNTGRSGLRTTAQVSGYEWDCLHGRYNSISIGKVFQQSRRRLPGYRLAQGAITYSKLAPDLISYIKGAD